VRTTIGVVNTFSGIFISTWSSRDALYRGVDALDSALLIVDVSVASSGGGALEEIDKFYIT
jgi:hypothetical protein